PQFVVAFVAPFIVFGFIYFLDAPVAWTLLGFAIFTLLAPAIFSKWDSANSRRRQVAYANFAAEFLDSLQGLATLKSFGQSGARAKLLATRALELFRSTMWVLATNSLARGITDTGLAVGAAVVLGLGAYRVVGGEMELSALLIILMMGIEVFRPQRELRALLHQGMVGEAAAKGINAVFAAEPTVKMPAVSAAPATLEPSIEFDDVRFTYPSSRRPTHDGLSFKVNVSERVGVVGRSGVGKSSIVRLILRLYDPDGGTVRIGGQDVRELPAHDLYRHIAVVNQDTYLFHGTVEENLRLGSEDATPEALEAAARAANVHDFVQQLPDGYRTVVGERGTRLSGGQRQRIAIARALLRDSPILILDEALSAVDAENEALIQEALDRLMIGRTTLIFAHRLSSIIGCDRLLVLEDGKVAEEGDHVALMARRGTYYALMRAQAGETLDVSTDRQTSADRIPRAGQVSALEDDVVQLEPTDAIVRAGEMGWMDAFRELLKHVKPWKGRLTLTFVFGVTRVFALIGVGVLSALVVAALKTGEPFQSYLVWLLVVAPFAGVLHWLESWVAHDMAFRLLAEMRIALFEKLDKLAPAYLLRRRSGDLVSMATQDVELVEYFFAHTVAPAFVAVLVPTLVLGTLFYFGPEMGFALIPFLAFVVLSPFFSRHRLDVLGSRAREALGDLNAHAVDTIQGLGEIVAFEHVRARREQFELRMRRHRDLRLPFFRDLTLQMVFLEIATGLGGLAIVVVGANLVSSGELEASLLPLLTLLAMAAFLPIAEIAHIGRQLADTLGATRRIKGVEDEPVLITDGGHIEDSSQTDANHAAGGVELALEGVRFRYFARNDEALSDVTFTVEAGSTVALVGPSGAGKTTIAHLLLRFFDPEQGKISMGGVDLRDYSLDGLRARIALVSQDTYLFNETLGQNILLAKPDATPEQLATAVSQAALDEFVAGLPQGLDTRVGERGVRLSGGQRQRVAIARAFLKDAPVLILDEATSHLDAVNEQSVRNALEELMQERTTVIIAHRLSTIRDADMIVVLEAGRVIEIGAHDELIAKRGLYSDLVGHQLAGVGVPQVASS
ncbi:MAG: thiol reductant ABC exporter subunit CydC, partial [Gammaproteobacteria bacterium]|nr:thiol reductant ABC exporter subunit CydC [Gammaproteobacteria bacterium]